MKELTTKEEWREYLQEGYKRTAESIIEFGKRMYEYKQSCETTSGGSTFSKDVEAWLNMSPSAASKWCKIGKNAEKLFRHTKNLPSSHETIYLLSGFDESELKRIRITPNITYKEVVDIANRLRWEKEEKDKLKVKPKQQTKEKVESKTKAESEEPRFYRHTATPSAGAINIASEENRSKKPEQLIKEILENPSYLTVDDARVLLGVDIPSDKCNAFELGMKQLKRQLMSKVHTDKNDVNAKLATLVNIAYDKVMQYYEDTIFYEKDDLITKRTKQLNLVDHLRRYKK